MVHQRPVGHRDPHLGHRRHLPEADDGDGEHTITFAPAYASKVAGAISQLQEFAQRKFEKSEMSKTELRSPPAVPILLRRRASMPREGLVTLAHVIYGLHAFSALTGMLSPALILTAFLTGWPSIIAVILNYVKRSEVRGTWLDSHFSWQIRTFWFALLWLAIGAVLFATVIGIPFAIVLWFATGIWVLYRIIRGWLALTSQKALPQ